MLKLLPLLRLLMPMLMQMRMTRQPLDEWNAPHTPHTPHTRRSARSATILTRPCNGPVAAVLLHFPIPTWMPWRPSCWVELDSRSHPLPQPPSLLHLVATTQTLMRLMMLLLRKVTGEPIQAMRLPSATTHILMPMAMPMAILLPRVHAAARLPRLQALLLHIHMVAGAACRGTQLTAQVARVWRTHPACNRRCRLTGGEGATAAAAELVQLCPSRLLLLLVAVAGKGTAVRRPVSALWLSLQRLPPRPSASVRLLPAPQPLRAVLRGRRLALLMQRQPWLRHALQLNMRLLPPLLRALTSRMREL